MGIPKISIDHGTAVPKGMVPEEWEARVLLAARLHTSAGVSEARLRDLSRHGALIESPAIVKPGSRVTFERGATHVPATVAWAAGIRIGLEFDDPIDESELLIHIGRARPAAPPPASYSRNGIARGMTGRSIGHVVS